MQPQAASLDIIASQDGSQQADIAHTPSHTPRPTPTPAPAPNGSFPSNPTVVIPAAQTATTRDSRASSSTNSPVPREGEESDFFLVNNDSQSSLGVPNIEDMQVVDEQEDMGCQTPIYALPNEVLIHAFSKMASPNDLLNVMLTCKRFAKNTVDLLWHRPACTTWTRHASICNTLSNDKPYFAYREFVRRVNLAALSSEINDGSIKAFHNCQRIERLTLTSCKRLTDAGLTPLVENNPNLLALDISNDTEVTERTINAIAQTCYKIQGLNVSNCTGISNDSLVALAHGCRYLKRIKLNDCTQVEDSTVMAFAQHCSNILEIDLQKCTAITNEPVTALLTEGRALRELRLASCELLDDSAFLSLPLGRTYDHLRILDLTSCGLLTDRAVEKIIDVAPRLRNLVLAKCRNITDHAVYAICKLGRNLHYVHLGHCSLISDDAIKKLVAACNRIRYIDLGYCMNLTDESAMRLSTLPKLKRIGLVRCQNITDKSVAALANMGSARHRRQFREVNGVLVENPDIQSSLERVHLSYCTNLTLRSVIRLLNASPRLTHLSLTGVLPFIREDLATFCRDAPPDFNEHQRALFCVFSGPGVVGLRNHLNTSEQYAGLREATGIDSHVPQPAPLVVLDDNDPDVGDDDDDDMVVEAGTAIASASGLAPTNVAPLVPTPAGATAASAATVPPPPPPAPQLTANQALPAIFPPSGGV